MHLKLISEDLKLKDYCQHSYKLNPENNLKLPYL